MGVDMAAFEEEKKTAQVGELKQMFYLIQFTIIPYINRIRTVHFQFIVHFFVFFIHAAEISGQGLWR